MINPNNRNPRVGACRSTACASGNGGDRGCRAILDHLRAVDFALTETVMYLDAYPNCREAMDFYRKLVAERKQLVDTYESQCGPLTMYGNDKNGWEWAQGPWPWEAEANG